MLNSLPLRDGHQSVERSNVEKLTLAQLLPTSFYNDLRGNENAGWKLSPVGGGGGPGDERKAGKKKDGKTQVNRRWRRNPNNWEGK